MRTLTYEFIVPSEIWLIDADEWQSIAITRSQLPMRIRKPLTGQKLVSVDGTLGNEGVDLRYSIMRIDVDVSDDSANPEWSVPFTAVKECLMWIRVAAQQFWIGASMSGSKSISRGSIITAPNTYTNFAAAKMPVGVPPLSSKIWHSIGTKMRAAQKPSVAEELFCEGMAAFANDDYFQAVILLGITYEIELNAFIDDLLARQNAIVKKLYDERRYNFSAKLKNVTELFGAGKYQDHNEQFASELSKLYDLRGSAVHRAQLLVQRRNPTKGSDEMVPVNFDQMSKFLFAVRNFLDWTKAERTRLGL